VSNQGGSVALFAVPAFHAIFVQRQNAAGQQLDKGWTAGKPCAPKLPEDSLSLSNLSNPNLSLHKHVLGQWGEGGHGRFDTSEILTNKESSWTAGQDVKCLEISMKMRFYNRPAFVQPCPPGWTTC